MQRLDTSVHLIRAARRLGAAVNRLSFGKPVTHVYNPLDYAWAPYEMYLQKFSRAPKRIVFLGMNPGPFGMVQTGVPFGEIAAVRNWLHIEDPVSRPKPEHPQRPVTGFECERSEVSGQRLWGLFASRFGRAQDFFADHIVMNYCPLAFLEATGRNRTPDKLALSEKELLFAVCDEHLRAIVHAFQPEWLIGIGDFATKRALAVLQNSPVKVGRILHPSPASPAANRDWPGLAIRQLQAMGAWQCHNSKILRSEA